MDYDELVYLYQGDDAERKDMIIERLKMFCEY